MQGVKNTYYLPKASETPKFIDSKSTKTYFEVSGVLMNQNLKLMSVFLILNFGLIFKVCATQITLINNSAPVELEKLIQDKSSGNIISASLSKGAVVFIGANNSLDLPAGTRIGFHPNNGELSGLKIFSLIITQRHLLTNWHVNDHLSIQMNCGRAGSVGASFIKFSIDGALNEGCKLSTDQELESENYHVLVNSGSKLRLTESGKLLYAQSIQEGQLLVNKKWVSLLPEQPLALHENHSPYYFVLNYGEEISLQTEFGLTTFGQSIDDNIFPTLMFDSGQISSGLYTGEGFQFSIEAFGGLRNLRLSHHSPVRFSADGNLHQVAVTDLKTFDSKVYAVVTRQELQYNFTQTHTLKPGDDFNIPAGSQLIIENNKLTGFTHIESQGFAFTYSIDEEQRLSSL